MAEKYSAKEVLWIAISIEENGMAFYKDLARSTEALDARELYDYLAAEEDQHIEDFRSLLKQIGGFKPPEAYPGDYKMYLKAIADARVFAKGASKMTKAVKAADARAAIDFALDREDESIALYQGMVLAVPPEQAPTIEKIIEQEKEHVRKLEALRETLE